MIKLIERERLRAIADAIRYVNEGETEYTLPELVSAIQALSTNAHSQIPANWQDGDSHFLVKVLGTPIVTLTVTGTGTIDWGDGYTETVTDSVTEYTHSYSVSGKYEWTMSSTVGFKSVSCTDGLAKILKVCYTNPTVYENSFEDCDNLRNVFLANTTSIGDYAFSNCDKIEFIDIPNSVTNIGSSAFSSCQSLKTIQLPSGIVAILDSLFKGCKALTTCEIPSAVMSIGSSAFEGCKALTSVTIPSGVTFIGRSAFYHCDALKSITIPSRVTSIGAAAFRYCSSVQRLDVLATTPPMLGTNALHDMNDCSIYVPSASLLRYKVASVWKNYASRMVGVH